MWQNVVLTLAVAVVCSLAGYVIGLWRQTRRIEGDLAKVFHFKNVEWHGQKFRFHQERGKSWVDEQVVNLTNTIVIDDPSNNTNVARLHKEWLKFWGNPETSARQGQNVAPESGLSLEEPLELGCSDEDRHEIDFRANVRGRL